MKNETLASIWAYAVAVGVFIHFHRLDFAAGLAVTFVGLMTMEICKAIKERP